MAVFHVFVEGATNADTLGARLGISAAEVRARLAKGRFRVKANVDRDTADRFVRDLTAAGARCAIEEGKPEFQSGLAAAFSSQAPAANLGALGQEGAALSLASVDGGEEPSAAPSATSFSPPPTPAAKPQAQAKAKPKDAPLDLFVPPETQEQEMALELAEERPAPPPPRQSSQELAKPARASQPSMAAASQSLARASQPSMAVAAPSLASRLGPLGEPRARFAAGVLLAVLLGFVPAHLVASMREKSAYATIDTRVRAAQQMADSEEAYAGLDRIRATALSDKDSARRNAALVAFAIWAIAGAGLAFVWFRKIPWDR